MSRFWKASQGNFKMALSSLKTTKMRSFLTMLGIIIGVVSVVTAVSIGEGIKQQVGKQIDQLGRDLITVRAGQVAGHGTGDAVNGVNLLFNTAAGGALDNKDLETIRQTPGIGQASPLGLVNGEVKVEGQSFGHPQILATDGSLDDLLHNPTSYGDFFNDENWNEQPNVAIIGPGVARQLFQQRVPIGKSFELMGQSFVVRGVLRQFDTSPLSLATDFNDTIFIPYRSAEKLTNGNSQLYEILARPSDPAKLDAFAAGVNDNLRQAHGGQQNFTVLRQDESLQVTNNILDLMTKLIAGVAAISLLVGGIGIMDVMLVSVAERMHEIGIRKALGASNRQIMFQFMAESTVLSLVGGLIGVLLSILINLGLRATTSIAPVLTWQSLAGATLVSLLVGIVFGTAPAMKAARKDPIDALRNS